MGGAHELLCAYARALRIARMCQIFTMQKNSQKKILPMAGIGEIGENSLLVKISAYTVTVRIGYTCSHAMPNSIVVMV